ncbi:hypothetical protein V5O48_015911 [Marasmius crinis-equi]|uniref:BZIP domain-containing protein n=1 Tax=Marasmius crinis-equi TaxID=585013 RepID=A0ABR3ET63_9AGAR
MAENRPSTPIASDDGVLVQPSVENTPSDSASPAAVETNLLAQPSDLVQPPGTTSPDPPRPSTPHILLVDFVAPSPLPPRSNHGWGDDDGSSPWKDPFTGTQRITSLTSREHIWSNNVENLFRWRPIDHNGVTDQHISHFSRTDIKKVLNPAGPVQPSPLDKLPNAIWARTQLVRILPEAQGTDMPGPTYDLSQLAARRAAHNAQVKAIKGKVLRNEAQCSEIRGKQQPLRDQLHALEKECGALEKENRVLADELGSLARVEKDLMDLEALALVYC